MVGLVLLIFSNHFANLALLYCQPLFDGRMRSKKLTIAILGRETNAAKSSEGVVIPDERASKRI
jgi:hypothetical protein